LPRRIDDILVESNEIDLLFHAFFRDYARTLPVLDPLTRPDYYHHSSKALLWALMAVVSRTHERTPGLGRTMSAKVDDLAVLATKTRVTIRSIQTLLILVTWRFPRESGAFGPTFLLIGMLHHMALQLGLHALFGQEFS
jgi:hypothetical protein